MAERNKRDWFATGESDDEEQGYDSENAEQSRGATILSRSSKRQKLDLDADESDDDLDKTFSTAREFRSGDEDDNDLGEADTQAQEEEEGLEGPDAKTGMIIKDRTKLAKKLAKAQTKAAKTGVVYLSRIPPFMKPHALRKLIEPTAPSGLGRIFLTPEDPSTHKARVKSGGNKKKSFLDGWVEFVSKREAKLTAETLNGKNIGGKKGNYYYDDVWNMKYLKGFKWRHLTEQISNENAERSARLRAEAARDRKEVREFLSNVERAKMLDGMEKKKKSKMKDEITNTVVNAKMSEETAKKHHGRGSMAFKQNEVISKSRKQVEQPSIDAQRVLSKIF